MVLDAHEDAYGAAIRDHHAGEATSEIVERDDGWIGVSAAPGLYFSTYDDWPDRERAAADRAEGRVLDVGCGAGRAALYHLLVSPAELREVLAPTAWERAEVLEPNARDTTGDYVAELRKS